MFWSFFCFLVLVFLRIPCSAKPDLDRHFWLMPNSSVNLTLQASRSGELSLGAAHQQESNCWQLISAKNNLFYVVSASCKPVRGLSIQEGKVVLAVGRGLPWGLQQLDSETYILSNAHGQLGYRLGDRQLRIERSGQPWVFWFRHPRNSYPAPGNLIRWEAGESWVVLRESLAGRELPSQTSKVVRLFRRGTVLRADSVRGGSDEVFWNSIDQNGNTWLKVSDVRGIPQNCYVRANSQWLRTRGDSR